MLHHPTLESLKALRLFGMLRALEEQQQTKEWNALSFEERLGLLVDRERIEQQNRSVSARLRRARLGQQAAIENVDLRPGRGLDRALFASLASRAWIGQHHNLLITGPTGVGKTARADTRPAAKATRCSITGSDACSPN